MRPAPLVPFPGPIRAAEGGFSLVEVVTAATIMGIAVSGLTIMMGNSDIMGLESDHFRQARAIAQHELEDSWSHFLNYGEGHQSWDMFLDLNDPDRVALSARDSVETDAVDRHAVINGETVDFRIIKATVTWREKSGQVDSLELSKRITNLR
jgi:hypothetical protein